MKRLRHLKALIWMRVTSNLGVKPPCHWCGQPFGPLDLVADHDPPLAEGGSPYRAVLACIQCDAERSRITSGKCNAKRGRGKQHKRRKKRSDDTPT